jgi:hypothetical protein
LFPFVLVAAPVPLAGAAVPLAGVGFAVPETATGGLIVGLPVGVAEGAPERLEGLAAVGGAAGAWAGAALVAGAGPPLVADGADAIAPVDPAGD